MVFLQIMEPLDDFLKRDKETRMGDIDWCLFDRYIKDRSLKNRSDLFGGGNHGNLNSYMFRTMFYNLFYKEPLYMYLMSENYFKKLDFLSDKQKNSFAVWNMKRVPDYVGAEEKYPRIPKEEMLWDGEYEEQEAYVRGKFKELAENKVEFGCVIFDGK